MKRTQAARLIDRIRVILAESKATGRTIDPAVIEDELLRLEVKPLVKCTGEAHSNPFIDNCSMCAPRWGWIGEKVQVK